MAKMVSNASAYKAFLEDQKKKEEEAKKGQVRFREASTASRVQYTLPGYASHSAQPGPSYDWEKEQLTPMKVKGAGNSHTKKFDALTKSMGMSDTQAEDYRRFLDFQQDSQQTIKTNKDGSVTKRQNVKAGQGAMLKSDLIDSIINGSAQQAAAAVRNSSKPKKEKPSFWSKAGDKALKALEILDRPGDAVRTGIKEKMDGNSFWQGAKDGFTGDKNTSGTELNKRLGFDPSTDKKDLGIARSVSDVLMNAGPTKFVAPFLNNQQKDFVAKELPGQGTEMALDPLNFIGTGATSKAVREGFSLPAQLSKVLDGADAVRYSDNAAKAAAQEALRGQASPLVRQAADAKPATNNILDELLNFASSSKSTPSARGVEKIANPARYAKENLSNQADTILNRVDAINGPTDYSKRVLDVQKAMQDTNNNDVFTGASQAMDSRQAAEDAFVEQQLAPHIQAAQQEANGNQVGDVVKSARDEINRIKQTYGKIKATKGEGEDYPIPPQFRAGVNNMAHDDLHSFATQEGMTPDEAIQYLKQLDLDSKMRPTKANTKYTEDFWTQLENEARQAFRQSDQGKALDELAANTINGQPNFDALYNASKGANDPQTFEELVKLAQMQDNVKDPIIPASNEPPGPLKINNWQDKGIVNNSQDINKVIDQLVSPKNTRKLSVEELNALMRGEKLPPKSEPNVTNEVKPESSIEEQRKSLLRLNLQEFESDNPSIISDQKPIESKSAIESIKNPIKRRVNKFYEDAINKTHSAKVAHTQILENEIKKLTESGAKPKKLEQLKGELKYVKKYGSDVEKAIQNEAAAGNKAKTFLDGHMENLQKALGSSKPEDMAEAIRYQVAKNVDWIWKNVDPEYVVGKDWDKGRINSILNRGVSNPKLEEFTKAMKNLTQERLDLALKHNLINKNAHTALSKNPYYIPMARDVTPGMDNVARGLKGGNTSNKRTAGAYFIQSLGHGDAEALYKDPLETLMSGTFSLFKNAAKSDSEQQLLKMAKLDSDNLFSRVVDKKEFDRNGGIAVPTAKGTKYIQLQDDLMKMIKENDLPYDLNVLGKMTSAFAGLKTRSLEYHITGAPRDIAEGYLKGQINNPIKYLSELVKAAKEHNLSAKQAGAYFDKAYKDGMNGMNPEKMMKEYARQNGNVKTFNPKDKESWKELVHTIGRIADMPFKPIKAIGQLSDELPRTVEVKATTEAFNKQHGAKINNIKAALDQVNSKLEASSGATDPFDPALKGVDKLKAQKAKLENMLNEYDKSLEREQTFRGRDIMNFSRAGRSGVAKHIRQYAIFANTTTQSKDKLVRSFIERPGATIGKVALLTAPLIYAEHVMQQNLTGNDKKTYDNLPSWAKQYNYVYVVDGKVITVPKIQELALLTNPIEAVLSGDKQELNDAARLAVKETVPYQLGYGAQGLVPNTDGSVTIRDNAQVPGTVLSPALDVLANDKLGFNRNAVSFADKFGRENPKANKFTMDLFKKTFGNKSRADYAQYLATQYPGDAGKYGTYTLDYLLDPKNSDKLDAMLENLNPLQDRMYEKNNKFFKNPPKKPAVDKKK